MSSATYDESRGQGYGGVLLMRLHAPDRGKELGKCMEIVAGVALVL